MKKKQKMYLVKREVIAPSIHAAMKLPGKIYSVELADEKFQPEDSKFKFGFGNELQKKKKAL